jgi:tetratricopeptide (TPR) repeat protein
MTDTRNRQEKPVLPPPQGEPPTKSASPLVTILIAAVLLALLVLSAIVIWLLPSKAPSIHNQNPPAQTTSIQQNNPGLTLTDPETRKTERLLETWLKSQAAAEAENIQSWGGEEYADILNSAARGDQFFRNSEFASAQTLYKEAIDNLEFLLASKDDKLREALIQGQEALEQKETEKARLAFQQAILIDPENEEALQGAHRANNLDHVIALYNEGLQMEVESNLEQAQQLLREASRTDSDFTPARAALERVDKKWHDLSFRDAMSRALAALDKGRLIDADKALDEAARLRPQDPAMTAARQRSAEMHKIQQLKNLQIKANRLINAEDWEGVVETYRKAFQIDDKVGFASIGMPGAEKRLQLDKSLKTIIARPARLQDEGPLREARQILKSAERVKNPGKIIQSQILTLSQLVQYASITVDVVFRSDNATEVEIYHIARFRPFVEKPIPLKPGTYTVVGRRPGFKDVRLSIKIEADMKMPVFFIRCEEPI